MRSMSSRALIAALSASAAFERHTRAIVAHDRPSGSAGENAAIDHIVATLKARPVRGRARGTGRAIRASGRPRRRGRGDGPGDRAAATHDWRPLRPDPGREPAEDAARPRSSRAVAIGLPAGPRADFEVMRIPRPLHRVLYSPSDPFHPDGGWETGPLPGLAPVAILAEAPPDSDRYGGRR